jgi:hypothetical protein
MNAQDAHLRMKIRVIALSRRDLVKRKIVKEGTVNKEKTLFDANMIKHTNTVLHSCYFSVFAREANSKSNQKI